MPTTEPASPTLTQAQRDHLRALASAAARNSYSPYSEFRVGAALLLVSGETVTAANVENCSFRLTCCAEQAAVTRAVAQHGPSIRLAAVAIANLNGAASTPCGACRQTLAEFADDTTPILYPGPHGLPEEASLGQLLPQAFRPSSLA